MIAVCVYGAVRQRITTELLIMLQCEIQAAAMNVANTTFLRLSTQFDNVGDALIVRELLRIISTSSDLVIDVSAAPQRFVDEVISGIDASKIRLVRRGAFLALAFSAARARAQGRACYYAFLPAGITGEKTGRRAFAYSLVTASVSLLARLGVRPIHAGASYSNLGPENVKLVRNRVKILHRHLVRDQGTRAYLERLGIRVDGLIPDLSFGLYPAQPSLSYKRELAFSFRLDRASSDERDFIQGQVSDIIRSTDPDDPCLFVSQVRRDDQPMSEMAAAMRVEFGERITFKAVDTIEDCLNAYREVRTVYSNRLHALLIAAYVGAVPVACVLGTQDGKIINIFEDLGLNKLVRADGAPFRSAELPAPDLTAFICIAEILRQTVAALYCSQSQGHTTNG